MTRLRIYVAGPYSSDNVLGMLGNMRRGILASEQLFAMGYAPFCPHLDYHYALVGEHALNEFYDYSMAWLEASDIVVILDGWKGSKGCQAEVARAKELGIPVVEFVDFIRENH